MYYRLGKNSKETLKAIEERKSIRKYKSEAIPESHLKNILRAARLAPSAGNRQPWRFIIVRDPEMKKKVAELSINYRGKMQMFIAEADVLVVALGDDENSKGRYLKWVDLDPMIAIEHLVLAAASMGYGTCWIGAFEEYQLKQILSMT